MEGPPVIKHGNETSPIYRRRFFSNWNLHCHVWFPLYRWQAPCHVSSWCMGDCLGYVGYDDFKQHIMSKTKDPLLDTISNGGSHINSNFERWRKQPVWTGKSWVGGYVFKSANWGHILRLKIHQMAWSSNKKHCTWTGFWVLLKQKNIHSDNMGNNPSVSRLSSTNWFGDQLFVWYNYI